MLDMSLILTFLLISFPLSLQVLSMETDPAYAKILGSGPAFIVSFAATKYIFSLGFHKYPIFLIESTLPLRPALNT